MSFVSPVAAYAATGNVVTVVGTPATSGTNAAAGFSPDGTSATSASVSAPQGIAVDQHGNIFFADTANAVVRMVPAVSGTYFGIKMQANRVYTIAGTNPSGGNAQSGFSGSGGLATKALLKAPKRLALDANGDVIFTDNGNDVVQVIAAQKGTLFGVSMAGAGYLYSIAGAGTKLGTFSDLHGVAFDPSGNLIITDTGNERVQLIAAAPGTFYGQTFTAADQIATIAGNGTDTFSDGAVATASGLSDPHDTEVDPSTGNLVIGDYSDNRIIVLAKTTGTFDGIAMTAGHVYSIAGGKLGSADGPAASASFYFPNGIAVDQYGNVLVADVYNNEIRVVAERTGNFYGLAMTAGNVYTIAGSTALGNDNGDGGPPSAAGFGQPSEVTLDSSGDVFVTEGVDNPSPQGDGNRIRELTFSGSVVAAPGMPSTPVATPGDGSVDLAWTAPTAGGGGITGYVVNEYAGSSASGADTQIKTPSATSSLKVTGLTNGISYTFTVQAVNSAGPGPASAAVTATPAPPVLVPGTPGTPTATPGDATVKLAWTAPTSGNSATDYTIDVYAGKTASGTPTRTIDTGSANLSHTVSGLTDGQSYTFTVDASNSKGAGPASAPVTSQPIGAPGVPGTPTATAANGAVNLVWTAPTSGGEPTDYTVDIYKGTAASGSFTVADLGGVSLSYRVAGLVNGQPYTFTIVAKNGSGSSPSASATAIPSAPPVPPSGPPSGGSSTPPPSGSPTPPAGPPTPPPGSTQPGSPPAGTGNSAYWLITSEGGVYNFGGADYEGSLVDVRLDRPIVGGAVMPGGGGYYMVASDGGVFAFGDAGFHGSLGGVRLAQPIVGMAVTPTGKGYWLFARDGGVFAFGDAGFAGSLGGMRLDQPIVGGAVMPGGGGYYMVASDGGVFAFGDAGFHGSLGGVRLAQPIVGMAVTPTGKGYWLFARDGGVFAFGDGGFHGSLGGVHLAQPVVMGMSTPSGRGYYLVAADGGVFPFGDASFRGSLGNARPAGAVVAGTTLPAA